MSQPQSLTAIPALDHSERVGTVEAPCATSEGDVAPDDETVQVWLAESDSLSRFREEYWTFLSEDEQARYQRLRVESQRTQFLLGRGLLRSLLATQIGIRPAQVTFRSGRYGKPELADEHGPRIHFSLSHTSGMIAVAVSRRRRVGIDAEHVNSVGTPDSLAPLCLAAAEYQEYCALPERQRAGRLLEVWTAKEAYLKTAGCGLNWNLRDLLVCRCADGVAAIRRARVHRDTSATGHVGWFVPGPEHLVAVSVGPGACLQFRWNWVQVAS